MATHPSEHRIHTPPTPDQATRLRHGLAGFEQWRQQAYQARTALEDGKVWEALARIQTLEREFEGLRDSCAEKLAPDASRTLACPCGGSVRVLGYRAQDGVWVEVTACHQCHEVTEGVVAIGGER